MFEVGRVYEFKAARFFADHKSVPQDLIDKANRLNGHRFVGVGGIYDRIYNGTDSMMVFPEWCDGEAGE